MSPMRRRGVSVGRRPRLADAPEVAEQLAAGEISFDRAAQLARLPETYRRDHQGYDVSQLRRLVADHKRLTRRRERRSGNGYLHFGSCDELAYFVSGVSFLVWMRGSWKRRSTSGPTRSSPPSRNWPWPNGRALALVAICQDSPLSDRILRRIRTCRCCSDRRHQDRRGRPMGRPESGSWPEPGSDQEPSKRSSVRGRDRTGRDHRERQTPGSGTTLPHRGPANCVVISSTEMVDAPWKAVPADTGSKSTMSNRGPTEATPTSTI